MQNSLTFNKAVGVSSSSLKNPTSSNSSINDAGSKVLLYHYLEVFEIRLEDLIYLTILAGLMVMFNLMVPDWQNPLFKGYRIFCVILFLASMVCLMIRPGIKYLILLIFCIFIPVTMNGIYSKWFSLDPAQSLDNYSILGYLSMIVVYGFVIIVYPLKSFINQKIGSLYSYLYALSFITLFGLWPFYSILNEMSTTGSITLSIIYNNKALVITFIVIIVFSFYLIVHRTFFQGDKKNLFRILRTIFTTHEISKAIDEMQDVEIKEYEWHNVTSRMMSMIVLVTTLGLQVFIFLNMENETRKMIKSAGLMMFAIIFLIMGTFYTIVPVSSKIAIPLFTVLSLGPAPFVFFFSTEFLYWEYICTIFCMPYVVLFWSVIRTISQYKPLLQNKILTMMYALIHIPIMVFMMDVLDYFGSGNQIGPVGYVAVIVVVGTISIAGLIQVVLFCIRILSAKSDTTRNTVQLDFNYSQTVNYQPYKKINSFSLSWVSEMDLLNVGIFFNIFLYLLSNTVSFYNLKELVYTFTPAYFFSQTIYEITYAQFIVLLLFMVYCNYFMTTNNDAWDLWMLSLWFLVGLACVVLSYILPLVPNMLRMIGGFCLVMFVVAIAFEYIKDSNNKILNFITPVLSISLWITVIIPYVIGIPTASIYVDQAQFGQFIYNCILASALLIIIIVGVVSLIFNILMNKFEEQKRYKYVIQDVKQFFDEEGVESSDEILHVFHQAYECRDKKYIFYLKSGYPINVVKDEQTQSYKLVTYDKYVKIKTTQNIQMPKQQEVDCVWSCLTFFCGQDQQEIKDKVKNAFSKKLLDEDQAENLFPEDKLESFNKMMETKYRQRNKQAKVTRIKPQQINSTKSLLLNSMTEGPRRLGPEYTLLKLQKSRKLGLEIWDSIFRLISNPDKGENMVIFNDFEKFCEISKIQMSHKECEDLFVKYAKSTWSDTLALNEEEFAASMEDIAYECYNSVVPNQKQRIMVLLVDKVYYNMARFQEFNQFRRQSFNQTFQLTKSGFTRSLQNYKQSSKQREKQVSKLVHFYKKQRNFLDQPRKQYETNYKKKKNVQSNASSQNMDDAEKGKSCKKTIYESYTKCRDCCSKKAPNQVTNIVKRERIKPWSYLAVQSAKILHRKDTLWQDQHQIKEYEFRLILNNIFMAVFKLADVYTYIEITLRDPQVQWYDGADFSFLYIDYKYQLYLCLALAFVTVPLGIKGISFISQDRLGLTEARVPAGFPHPMFFYTVIYKLLVLSLFVTISSTFLVTFSCTWTQAPPFKHYQDQSIECLSTEHNIYIILSLIFLIVYFPLSSYTFPNFQFSEKRLDLKYRPSYLVLYFQINFVLVANKVLLSQAGSTSSKVQIAFISINICSLAFLSIVCLKMKPCLIEWFNWVEFLTIFLGLIWNIGGLVLYLTQMWTLCVIIFGSLSIVSIIVVLLIIKRFYFSSASLNAENDEDEVKELQLGRKYKQTKQKIIMAQREMLNVQRMDEKTLKPLQTQNGIKIRNKNEKDLLIIEDVISNSEGGEDVTVQSGLNM